MRELSMSKGFVALADENDYELLSMYHWWPDRRSNTIYARAHIGGKKVYMHLLLMGSNRGFHVDHRDRNGLNNQRYNLRISTVSQNLANQKIRTGGTSRFKGVCWSKRLSKWHVTTKVRNKSVGIGYFTSETEAALAYDVFALKTWGEFALLNFPKGA